MYNRKVSECLCVCFACREKERKGRERVSESTGEVALKPVVDDALESMER